MCEIYFFLHLFMNRKLIGVFQIYEGDFKEDKREGHGILIWPSKKVYEGQWKNNQMHGKGSLTSPNGKRIEGQWVNNKKVDRKEKQ